MNNKIEGIIIDAGHGGIDSGAVGNNLLEKDLTLRASKYMYNRLKELNIPVKLTREEDEYLPKQDRIKRVLSLYNNSPRTILISNHINAGGAEGAEVIYSLKDEPALANLILQNIANSGQIPRKIYQRRLPENPNQDYYYILRETGNTTPLLIEYGFIDNKNDALKLNNNIEQYAEGVIKAISEYLNYPYFPPDLQEANNYYVVEKGDTLYAISKRFNIPVEVLKKINNLENNILQIGQTIYLEDIDNIEENSYIVKKNDTLWSIAQKYNTTTQKLKEWNNLVDDNLKIGQALLVSNPDIKEDINIKETIYTVEKGDSLWKIAQKYNISVKELIEKNNLTDLTIQIGQKLLIPIQEDKTISNNTYTVKKGDTLWSVAKNNNITVNELKEKNNLNNNLLKIGQVLNI